MKLSSLTLAGAGLLLALPLAAQTVERPVEREVEITTEAPLTSAPDGRTVTIDTVDGGRRIRIEQKIEGRNRGEKSNTVITKVVVDRRVDSATSSDGTRQRVIIRNRNVEHNSVITKTPGAEVETEIEIQGIPETDDLMSPEEMKMSDPSVMDFVIEGGPAIDFMELRHMPPPNHEETVRQIEQYDAAVEDLQERQDELHELLESATLTADQRKQLAAASESLQRAHELLEQAQTRLNRRPMFLFHGSEDSTASFPQVRLAAEGQFLVAPTAPLPPLPPAPPQFGNCPQPVIIQGDSLYIAEGADGARVIKVYETRTNPSDSNLVINELYKDGRQNLITLFGGPVTIMNGGGARTKIICMKGDSALTLQNIENKLVMIRAHASVPESADQEAPAKNATPTSATRNADGYRLEDAIPNPTEGTVTIAFNLAKPGRATLAIYDENGTLVKSVRDEEFGVGRHNVTFDAGELPNGTYFYRLTSGDFVQSKALHVIK